MRKSLKTIPALLLAGIFLCVSCLPAQAQPLESAPPIQLTAPSYLLADAETGAIIFEKNADTPRQVASLTKLMTVNGWTGAKYRWMIPSPYPRPPRPPPAPPRCWTQAHPIAWRICCARPS